jgi:hypothetical protein
LPFEALALSTSLELSRPIPAPEDRLAEESVATNPRLTVDLATQDDAATAELDPDAAAPDLEEGVVPPFASKGSRRWYVVGGFGVDATDTGNTMALAGLGFSQFIEQGLSLDLEFAASGYFQEGDDGYGLGAALIFRWHIYSQPDWTIFFEGGAGLMGTTNKVPADGSGFNFTPQAGIGYTKALDDGARLLLGVRWFHVSNARTFEDNPGRDHVLGYVGISFPH